ncbi:MAG: Ig-like domain-containing protein, partial [Chloroflexi bacterium]|nr:Ig-like domain-containing protein [Chloroflexota bacterium]
MVSDMSDMRIFRKPICRTAVLGSVIVAVIMSAACRPDRPTAVPSSAPSTPTAIPPTATALPSRLDLPYTPVPMNVLSPVVIQRTPEPGEQLKPDGVIELVFDRAMDRESVEAAFTLQPQIEGKLAWADARTINFKPSAPLPRNATIDVALTQAAKAADGAMLREPYQFRFVTQGNLEVGQTIPATDAQDVQPDTIVTVLFNRPVVPLTTLNEQAGLPQPLSFDPPIEGKAEWLNTSILVFRPAQPLPGGMTFKGRIDAALKDADGNPLAGDYTWTFSTSAPKVLTVTPDPQGRAARIDTAVSVQFNQDVDAASAQAAFMLSDAQGGAVAGQFAVLSDTLADT